jgi:hypothetical protein
MKSFRNTSDVPASGIEVIKEGDMVRLFFDFAKVETTSSDSADTESGETKVEQSSCTNIDIVGAVDYSSIVSAIVNGKYNNNDVQAIIANYELAKDSSSDITDDKRTEYLNDYAEFQTYRAHAKEIANQVLTLI